MLVRSLGDVLLGLERFGRAAAAERKGKGNYIIEGSKKVGLFDNEENNTYLMTNSYWTRESEEF